MFEIIEEDIGNICFPIYINKGIYILLNYLFQLKIDIDKLFYKAFNVRVLQCTGLRGPWGHACSMPYKAWCAGVPALSAGTG